MKCKSIILLSISMFLFQCAEKNQPQETTSEKAPDLELAEKRQISADQFELEELSLTKIGPSSFPRLIKTTGTIDVPPNNRAVISAHIGGYVKQSPYLVGDQVKKGDFLLSLENIEFLQIQQDYLEASEQQKYLESEYKRKKQLLEEKIASEKAFLKAESEYKKNLAVVRGLKEKLELLHINPAAVLKGEFSSSSMIYAPISGDITEIDVKIGQFIGTSDQIMEIINTEHIHLELKIFEKDALLIEKGQLVKFRIPESTDQNFGGSVYLIGRSIGADRSIKVHAHIDDESAYNFIPGMFAQANIEIESGEYLSLPEDAVIEAEGESFGLMVTSVNKQAYTYQKLKLITGRRHEGYVQILNEIDSVDLKRDFILGGYNLILEDQE